MKSYSLLSIFLTLCLLLSGCTVKPVVTSSPSPSITPSLTPVPLPVLITEPTNTQEITSRFTPIPSSTPWEFQSGLSIEEHPLAIRPKIEPLLLYPLDNLTQAQMFAKHAKEFQNGLRPESYYGGGDLWVMQGNDKLEAVRVSGTPGPNQRTLVGVSRNSSIIFSTWNEEPGVTTPFRALATYDDHWVLELAERKDLPQNQEVDSFFRGKIFVDGKSLNELYGYEESYGFQTIHGRPFYFYKKDGKIGISYDGTEIPLNLDGVTHYGCCSVGELNPRMAQNMIAFFAWRGDQWYYIEIGVFGTS